MKSWAVNEVTTYRWSFEEDVRHYAAAKIPAMGVWRQKLSDFGEEKGIELLADAGLAVSSLHWAGGFTGSDGRSHAESIDDAREAIRLAAALKADCLILHTGARAMHTHSHVRRLFGQALDKILPLAELLGVVLALEPMQPVPAAQWTTFTCLKMAREFVLTRGSASLRLALDLFHWGHHQELLDFLPELTPSLVLVQLADGKPSATNDPERLPLGQGTIALATIVEVLSQANFTGRYELEMVGHEIDPEGYPELLQQSQQVFSGWRVGLA